MTSLLNASFSTAALLIVLLVLSCSSSTIAQAGDNTALRIGLVRFGGMEHRTGSAEGYLLVYSATDEVSDGDLIFNAHSSYRYARLTANCLKMWKITCQRATKFLNL